MSNYRRPKRPGATVFFTVNLADQSSRLLTQEIATLRMAVAQARAKRWMHGLCCPITCIAFGRYQWALRITQTEWAKSRDDFRE